MGIECLGIFVTGYIIGIFGYVVNRVRARHVFISDRDNPTVSHERLGKNAEGKEQVKEVLQFW